MNLIYWTNLTLLVCFPSELTELICYQTNKSVIKIHWNFFRLCNKFLYAIKCNKVVIRRWLLMIFYTIRFFFSSLGIRSERFTSNCSPSSPSSIFSLGIAITILLLPPFSEKCVTFDSALSIIFKVFNCINHLSKDSLTQFKLYLKWRHSVA